MLRNISAGGFVYTGKTTRGGGRRTCRQATENSSSAPDIWQHLYRSDCGV